MTTTPPPRMPVTPTDSSSGNVSPGDSPSRFDLGPNALTFSPSEATTAVSHAAALSPPNERTHLLSRHRPAPLAPQVRYWSDPEDVPQLSPMRSPRQLLLPPIGRPPSGSKPKRSANRVAKKIRKRSRYYIPVTDWLPQYSWSLFSGDLVAGVSVACLMVPQAMSYANGLAGLTPVAGLWASAVSAIVYGALGTCRQMSMGPEASLSLLLGQTVKELIYSDPHSVPENAELEAIAVSVIVTFQVGVITTVLGLLRLGFLDVVLSRALMRGFLTAIGFIILVEQSIPLLGLVPYLHSQPNPPSMPVSKLIFVLKNLSHANIPTTILSACCLGFLIFCKVGKQIVLKTPGGTWVRFVPEILIVVVTTTVLCKAYRWDDLGVEVLGSIKGGSSIPFGLPLTARTLKYFNDTLPTAFVMAVVGVVDSMIAARENATKYGYPVSPNRELIALGSGNLASSFVVGTGSLPIFGSLTRSRLNGAIGARTQMSGLITAAILILSVFFLLPSLFFLPKAVLASIITMVVYTLLSEAPHDIIFFWKMRAWTDFAQMTGTFLLTLLFSIEVGLVASVGFSLILVIQRSTTPRIKIIGRRPNSDEWVAIDEDDEAREEMPGVLVVRIRESLSFANTGQLKERLRRLELYGPKKSHPSDSPRRSAAKAVIMHMGDVDEIDASALQILSELVTAYHERGVGFYFAHLHPQHLAQFHLVGITDLLGPHHFQPDLRSAMQEVESLGFGGSLTTSHWGRDRWADDA